MKIAFDAKRFKFVLFLMENEEFTVIREEEWEEKEKRYDGFMIQRIQNSFIKILLGRRCSCTAT